jgi:uncharacterized protein YjbI with pentapeptide repeats
MHRIKRDIWKVAFVLVSLLFILVVMMWVPTSAAEASNSIPGLPTPTPTVQATPTEDATVTVLSKEKLIWDINKDQSDRFWAWTSSGIIIVGLAGVVFSLAQYFIAQAEKRVERDKKDEEEFHSLIRDLGSDKVIVKIDATITLRKFLRPGYEQFYKQIFDWMVINLRQQNIMGQPAEPTEDFREELITTFKTSYPGVLASLKPSIATTEFIPASLDASRVQLNGADLARSDLRGIGMPNASLSRASLAAAILSRSYLNGSDFLQADLTYSDLRDASLFGANLSGASLRSVTLKRADLSRADLSGADLSQTDLSSAILFEANLQGVNLNNAYLVGADLSGANIVDAQSLEKTNLHGVKGLTEDKLKVCKVKGAIIDEDTTTNPPQSPVSPSPPSQSTNAQVPSASSAQGSTPTPATDGSGTSSQPSPEP